MHSHILSFYIAIQWSTVLLIVAASLLPKYGLASKEFFFNIKLLTSGSHCLLKACVLYILRVGVTDQMTEPTQRSFLVFLGGNVS